MISNNEIRLRPIEESDLEILTRWNYDPEISRFLPEKSPLNWEKQKIWIHNQINSGVKEKYVIELKSEFVPLGMVSAINIDRENRELEFGITLGNKSFSGKGYARMASELFIDHYFGIGFSKIYLRVFSDNHRAISLFEKLGFRQKELLKERKTGGDGQLHQFIRMELEKNKV